MSRMEAITLLEKSQDRSIDGPIYQDFVLHHLCINSFGEDVSNDALLVLALRQFLSEMQLHLKQRPIGEIIMQDAYDVANVILKRSAWSKFPTKGIQSLSRTDECRLAFEAGFVALLASIPEHGSIFIHNEAQLLDLYDEFKSVEKEKKPDKLAVLLEFRNWMKLAMLVIPAYGKKDHLLDLVARLAEGRHKKYISGSGETAWTARRVLIYRREGNVLKSNRPSRKAPDATSSDCLEGSRRVKKTKTQHHHHNRLQQHQLRNPEPGISKPAKSTTSIDFSSLRSSMQSAPTYTPGSMLLRLQQLQQPRSVLVPCGYSVDGTGNAVSCAADACIHVASQKLPNPPDRLTVPHVLCDPRGQIVGFVPLNSGDANSCTSILVSSRGVYTGFESVLASLNSDSKRDDINPVETVVSASSPHDSASTALSIIRVGSTSF